MQTKYYPTEDGYRVWLSPSESETLLDVYRGQNLERALALMLGLHGLRSAEVVNVRREHFRQLDGAEGVHKLRVPMGKGRMARECPASPTLVQMAGYSDRREDEALIDVTTKSLRDWIKAAREQLVDETGNETWRHVAMHDLRRTWATTTFYALAAEGVPIAEELTMGWGGWKMTSAGRETFRENYLGPEPDWISEQAMGHIELPGD